MLMYKGMEDPYPIFLVEIKKNDSDKLGIQETEQ